MKNTQKLLFFPKMAKFWRQKNFNQKKTLVFIWRHNFMQKVRKKYWTVKAVGPKRTDERTYESELLGFFWSLNTSGEPIYGRSCKWEGNPSKIACCEGFFPDYVKNCCIWSNFITSLHLNHLKLAQLCIVNTLMSPFSGFTITHFLLKKS